MLTKQAFVQDTTSSPPQSKITEDEQITEKDIALLELYMSKFDGSYKNVWDEHNVKELLPQVFHKDFHFRLNEKESLDYNGWCDLVMSFLEQGNKSELIQITRINNNQLLNTIRNTPYNQMAEESKQLVTYKDSKIIYIKAMPEDRNEVDALFKKVLHTS